MDPFDLRLWKGFTSANGNNDSPAIVDQITIDSRRIDSKNALFVALEGNRDGHRFISHAIKSGVRYILAKKDWIPSEPLGNTTLLQVDHPLSAFQEIAGTYRQQMKCRVIAIAGSYGKTMVKDLLNDILKTTYRVAASPESFNSQIGVPLSLLTITKDHEIALIEAGISEKNEMDTLSSIIDADHCIITHIGKKHLSTLGNLHTSAGEMMKLLKKNQKDQWAILPYDPHVLHHLNNFVVSPYFWTNKTDHLPHASFTSEESSNKMSYRVQFPDGTHYSGQITSEFYYFLDLINITLKAAWLLNSTTHTICESLQNYNPEPMRTEIWKSPTGALFINDTYCSDPQSIDSALKHLDHGNAHCRRIFIFGGMRGKHQHIENDYKRIGKAIHAGNIDLLILYGPHDYTPLIDEVTRLSSKIEIQQKATIQSLLEFLQPLIKADDAILFKGEHKLPIDLITKTFNDSTCNNQWIINFSAVAANIEHIRNKINRHTRCMVMVKALAYGTDNIRMAKFLETCGIDILGVSCIDEGVALKRAGATQSIFVINAAIYEAEIAVKWDLEIGVSDQLLIEEIAAKALHQKKKIKVHLHVDTGMGRFGCRPEKALGLAILIQQHPSLILEGIMTHFSCADDPAQDAFTISQTEQFDRVIAELKKHSINPPWRHAANSSGCIRFNFKQYNMVRIGLAVYGLHSSEASQQAMELRLAHSLVSRIVGINHSKKGESIGYGRRYCVERDHQKIAILPIGYFDGLHRNYSGKGVVIVRGRKAPMIGNICMDFMMIDVSDIPNADVGDSVLIFGEDEYGHFLSPEELASCGNSIVHELVTCLGPRIQRLFVYEEAHRSH